MQVPRMCGVVVLLLVSLMIPAAALGDDPGAGNAKKPGFHLVVTYPQTEFRWKDTYPGAVIIRPELDKDESSTPGYEQEPLDITITATVVKGTGTLKLFEDDPEKTKRPLSLATKTGSKVSFSLDLRAAPDPPTNAEFVVEIKAIRKIQDDEKEVAENEVPEAKEYIVVHVNNGYQKSFLSDVVASEFFLGATFSQEYDDAGMSEGFGNTAALARLSIDTLWGYNKPWAIHTRIELTGSEIPSELSDEGDVKSTEDTLIKYADSFGGSLGFYYFPGGKLAMYKPTSRAEKNRYDAFRIGLVGRFGIITRDTRGVNGDSVINYYQAGFSFTHHQTKSEIPKNDNNNAFPIRFAELKYGRYEEFAGVPNSDRIIFDCGIRLANTANGAIPFYAGLHVNAGDGADDIRIFAGFLFQLDKLAEVLN